VNTYGLARLGPTLFAGTFGRGVWRRPVTEMTHVDREGSPVAVPDGITLEQNYPNPFNPATVVQFSVYREARVRLAVYDLTGREVAVLVDGVVQPGVHAARWDASGMASGVYFYRLSAGTGPDMQAGGETRTRRMTLVR
jgi:hypothetical protein